MTRTETAAIALAFPGLSRPIHLHDAPEVLGHLHTALAGWQPSLRHISNDGPAMATLRHAGGRYVLRSEFLDEPLMLGSAASAFCGLVADLAQGWLDDHPDEVALHAGAISVDGRGIVFAGQARAGKSTLMARLTAEPWLRVLGDDVLPITPDGAAMALGVPPRLRLPLPPAASDRFRHHVAAHLGPHDHQYAYMDARLVAPHGMTARMCHFVILSRRKHGPASLHQLPLTEATAHLLTRNMATVVDEGLLAERISTLAAGVGALRLIYSDLEEAVALIHAAFATETVPEGLIGPAVPADSGMDTGPAVAPAKLGVVWQRAGGVGLRRRGEALMLWQAGTGAIFLLNTVAAAVWTMLEDPTTGTDVARVLQQAFPDAPPARIAGDLALLLGRLAEAGLIRPGDTRMPAPR